MSATKKLIEKIRGIQKGDYVRIDISGRKSPVYGEVREVINEYCWLHGRVEKCLIIYLPKYKEMIGVCLEDKEYKVRLARRRKKK